MSDAQTKEKSKPEVAVVTMEDGSQVEFSGKKKMIKEKITLDSGHLGVKLLFRSGKVMTFDITASGLVEQFAQHGAEQKLGDEIAGIDDVEDCEIAVEELIGRLNKGEWRVERQSSGVAGTSVLVRAMVQMTGKPIDQIKLFLSQKSQAEKIALRNSAKLKPIVEAIEAEKAAKGSKVDTEALFAELETTPAE